MIPVYRPYLPSSVLRYAHDALDSGWLSQGPWLQKATEKLQEILGLKYLLLVNNGTSATHLMVKAARRKFPQTRHVLIGDNVYIAALNAWLFDNQKIDIQVLPPNTETWNFESELEVWDKLYYPPFVMAVHNLGNIINIPELKRKYPNLIFLEDNCEGLFGKYENQYSGTASFASSLSFFGNKTITSGEGGAIILSDEDSYQYVKCLHGQGQSQTKFLHSELGYNYRMTNIQAAILYGQLEILPEILEKKETIFDRYRTFIDQVGPPAYNQFIEPGIEHANWMFAFRLEYINRPDISFQDYFAQAQIETRPMFYPLKSHPFLQTNPIHSQWWINFGSHFNLAEKLHNEIFILPSYPDLTQEEQSYILSILDQYIKLCKEKQWI